MQKDGGEADFNAGPTKRMRRPSVRLHQPYYENPGHRKLRQQWKAMMKKDSEGAKKTRTARTVHVKCKKNDAVSERSKGEMEGLNFDDEVAIGNWKNFNAANREKDFKRKRVRPSSSKKWSSANEDLETEKFYVSSGGEGGTQGEEKGGEENLGANGINRNLAIENYEPSSPNCSFGNDDGNDKLSDDDNNVGGNRGMKLRELWNSRDSNEMREDVRTIDGERDGVKVWLNQLGLGKYAPLFKVHEVDDEVLPFLTLEDLKDMGINAVGSRRKMYASIEKLGKGFQ